MKTLPCFLTLFALAALFLLHAEPALATTTGTAWDTPLQRLREVFTGPIPVTLSLVGIVVAGGALIFGGELPQFAKSMIMLILVIAILVGANGILGNVFNLTAATVRSEAPLDPAPEAH